MSDMRFGAGPPAQRSRLQDMLAGFRPQAAGPLSADLMDMQSRPQRGGAQLTMPDPGFVPGQRPLMPRFDGAPLVSPDENARTMFVANMATNTGSSMPLKGLTQAEAIEHILSRMRADPMRYFGLRVIEDEAPRIGSILAPSRRWVNGDPTNRLLSGTSASRIAGASPEEVAKSLRQLGVPEAGPNGYYFGRNALLVGGNEGRRGQDVGEILIRDPRVLSAYRKQSEAASPIVGLWE